MLNFRTFTLAIQKKFIGFDHALDSLDDLNIPTAQPIFILGAPRSGTTAIIQAIYQCLELSYISNLMALLPKHMIRIARLYPQSATGYKGHIKPGKFGYIPGLFSPSEAGEIMHYWFDNDLTDNKSFKIRATIYAITRITGNPILFKNLTNTIRAEIIKKVIPGCRFLYIQRDPLYTAQSILLARRSLCMDDRTWWSTRPPGYEKIMGKDIYYQVVWQVLSLHRISERIIADLPSRALKISYEYFCDEPVKTVNDIASGFGLEWRQTYPSAINMGNSNNIRLSPKEWDNLQKAHEHVTNDEPSIKTE